MRIHEWYAHDGRAPRILNSSGLIILTGEVCLSYLCLGSGIKWFLSVNMLLFGSSIGRFRGGNDLSLEALFSSYSLTREYISSRKRMCSSRAICTSF